MFGRTNNCQNKRQQPIPGDENVRKEAEFEEDQKSVQPMGNEAANVELMNEILNEPEVENRLNISDENIENFRERPNTGKKKNLNPDKLLINYRSSGNDLDNSNTLKVRADGKEESFTPTHYESYIQIEKDPKTAIEKYKRYKELNKKRKDKTPMSDAEKKELGTLDRLEDLAQDFDNAHNYMLDKDDYNQQDIDYAFRLHDKETKGLQTAAEFHGGEDINEAVRDDYKSASGIYITLFMDKFFRDLKEQWMKDPDEGGLPENDCMNFPIVRTWMDKYLSDRVKRNKKGFEMIVRGLYRSMKAAAPNSEVGEQDLLNRLADVIMHTCVNRNFENDFSPKAGWGLVSLASAVIFMAKNKSFEFTKMVSDMFLNCELEGSGMELRGW